jgi:hypothetical protein
MKSALLYRDSPKLLIQKGKNNFKQNTRMNCYLRYWIENIVMQFFQQI